MQKYTGPPPVPQLGRREFVLRSVSLAAFPFVLADCGGDNHETLKVRTRGGCQREIRPIRLP
jgi:hypothetical protein